MEDKKTLGNEVPNLDESYLEDIKTPPETIDGVDIKNTLSYYVNMITKFVRGKATAEELDELGNEMVIREYIPMKEKYRLIATIIFKMDTETDDMAETVVIAKEKNLFFDVLLTAYCGINCENQDLKTYATYDLLYPILSKYILQFCGEDYKKLVEMLDSSLNIYRMKELNEILGSVDYAEIKKVTQENEALLKKFYQEKDALEKLKELFVATDDNARKIVDYAKNEAVIEAGKKMAGEKEEKVKGSVEEVKPKKKAGRPKKTKE